MVVFSCPPQARQLILQYGLTLSDLDQHPEVRERGGRRGDDDRGLCLSPLFCGPNCSWAPDILVGPKNVSQLYSLLFWELEC